MYLCEWAAEGDLWQCSWLLVTLLAAWLWQDASAFFITGAAVGRTCESALVLLEAQDAREAAANGPSDLIDDSFEEELDEDFDFTIWL